MANQRQKQKQGARPFLKWAGGKHGLLAQYDSLLPAPAAGGRYFEPFIGSAAVFFHLQPARATLADANPDLINVYRVVRDCVDELIAALKPLENDEILFYKIRGLNPADLDDVTQAARLIYLNRTCYNGLYRQNKKGEFNVPFGRYKNPKICNEPRLRAAAAALQGVDLKVGDFADVVAAARPGDFVYFDPPYVPLTPTSSFTSYNQDGFNAADQRRLAELFHDLTARGVHAALSNASAPLVYELYEGRDCTLHPIQARRAINSKANGRGKIKELLIVNHR